MKLALSFHLRGRAPSIRVAQPQGGQLLGKRMALYRCLGHGVSKRDLDALKHAGKSHMARNRPHPYLRRRSR